MSGPASDFYGLTEDEVLSLIENGALLADIASKVGRARNTLSNWLSANPDRSARAHESRCKSASYWDDRAQVEISLAADPFELAKAKELAHHYRWRASKIAPRDYGDKTQTEISGPGGGAIPVSVSVSFVVAKQDKSSAESQDSAADT